MTAQRPLARGILVALEGIDGTGKSTQARRLAAHLPRAGLCGGPLREPTLSPWGRRIREAMTAGHRRIGAIARVGAVPAGSALRCGGAHQTGVSRSTAGADGSLLLLHHRLSGGLGDRSRTHSTLNEAFAPVPDLVLLLMIPPAQALERIRQARGQTDECSNGKII